MKDQDNENEYAASYVERCMHCTINYDENPEDPYRAKCDLCDRYFQKGKLFLNNVG
jgi:hypothetical protein